MEDQFKKNIQAIARVKDGCIDTLIKALEDYIYVLGSDDIELNHLLLKVYGKMRANNLDPAVIRERLKSYHI